MSRVIMLQGTMSGVGKSLLTAGLCRILKQDGYKAAPFKSQNMALNSFVTKEGLEMGRAQVMQAQAAGTEPVVAMNPILLKPTSDTGSQVIVNGEVRGNMGAREYFAYKTRLIPEIRKAYAQLEAAYDVIVIEGAGSPAEINLKENDIVNMGLAGLVDAPVLLIGDIDRGGVFAQLLGTMMLLAPEERKRVKGLIINKFRGDKSILEPGIAMLEEQAGVPVLGVTPYLRIDLEEEDSLSERLSCDRNVSFSPHRSSGQEEAALDIAVIYLPRISNYTDFLALENRKEAGLRYVKQASRLGVPDLILLPGTKNTMGDLKWLRESGMEAAILRAKEKGSSIFGICGGFQMLGRWLKDPDGVEEGGRMRGMGLLPLETVFDARKVRTRVEGNFSEIEGALKRLSGCKIEGYEIHMGSSRLCTETAPSLPEEKSGGSHMTTLTDEISGEEKTDGYQLGNVYGTYVHGIFDSEGAADCLLKALAAKKGITLSGENRISMKAYRERQFDKLADALRGHLDMARIYQILG